MATLLIWKGRGAHESGRRTGIEQATTRAKMVVGRRRSHPLA
jgi:hypothetical protein